MIVVFPLLVYIVVASLVALPVITKARRAMPGAPRSERLRAAGATCAVAVVAHLLVQMVPALRAGELDTLMVLLLGWVGPLSYLAAIVAVVLLLVGRRRHSTTLLAAAQGAAISLYLFVPLTFLELYLLGLFDLRSPAY